ncbi:MAG: lysozyme inhibitor LprI family protein [Pseudomonadota bacterium]|nr:lysozyme inhibitor LprI family protein [Pseudomonadota bacterium]
MKKLFILLTLVTTPFTSIAQTQAEMNMDALETLKSYKRTEQLVLNGALSRATPTQQKKLQRMQELWEEYTRIYSSLYIEGHTGSARPMCASYVQEALTNQNAQNLKSLITREEGDVCTPVWMLN